MFKSYKVTKGIKTVLMKTKLINRKNKEFT